nr:LysM peptidoglycan-binding domain-containing protein [Nitrososphaeria archaeon]
GDTLFDIGKQYEKDWRELAELNDLEIVEGDVEGKTVPIVWLNVGQKILIEDRWTEEEINAYKADTKAIMSRAFVKMAAMRKPPEVLLKPVMKDYKEMSVPELESFIKNIKGYYKWRRWMYEMERRKRLVDLINESVDIWANPWSKTDLPWVAHRKMCMFMTASIWYESQGFNVVSNKGARNFLQILPHTATTLWRWKWREKKEEVINALDTMPTFSIITAIKYWNSMRTQDIRMLASYYHGGRRKIEDFKPETVTYATKVVNKYRGLMNE